MNQSSTRKTQQQIVVLGVLLILLIGNVVATHNVLTEPYPGHNDYLTIWEAGRSFWRDGLNPYDEATTINIQTRIYGRPATEDEFPNYYAYPLYTLGYMVPFIFVSYAWASAIWMVLLEVCLIVSVILLFDVFKWRPQVGLLAGLLLWTLANYFSARGLLLGQVGTLIVFIQILSLWSLAKGHDRLTGVLLALSTAKPQMGFLIVPFLLLWALRFRRWQIIMSFAAVWLGLMLASFALLPNWMAGWFDQIERYPDYTVIGSPAWVVMDYYLGLGSIGEWTLNVALWLVMLTSWYMVLIQGQRARVDWAIMITLTITHISALRTATPHFVIFMVPMIFYFRLLHQQGKVGRRWIWLILLALLILPWGQFLLTIDGDQEHPSLYIWLPFGMLILLLMTRHVWWNTKLVFAKENGA